MSSHGASFEGLPIAAKRELLRRLTPDETASLEGIHPLSPEQRALWFIYRLAPDSPAYNLTVTLPLAPGIEPATLERALALLVERHAMLRTTYATAGGEPFQLVRRGIEVPLARSDASGWDPGELDERSAAEADRPFDLERGPVVRARLFSRPGAEHRLQLTVHHIACDFRSLEILLNELSTAAAALREGGPVELSELPRDYFDFVRYKTALLTSERGDRLRSYWLDQLGGSLPVLDLATDRPRPPMQTFEGRTLAPIVLGEELTRGLASVARGAATTIYTTVLAALSVLLHRYTAQDDILVSSPFGGRTRPGFQGVVGYFVNSVILRADLSGNPPFTTFLGRMKRVVLEAIEHAEYPFPLLVDELGADRDPSRSPLGQVGFAWDKFQMPQGPGGGAVEAGRGEGAGEDRGLTGAQRGALFDLALIVLEREGSLSLAWLFNVDLFDEPTIVRMAEHFERLLAAIVADSDTRLGDLDLLGEAERRSLLVEWNDTARDFPRQLCVHELFERQAERTPDALAVASEGARLSYRELDRRANRLAHRLRGLGVRAGSLVGVCTRRTADLVVALLGALKAGAAYAPLDPADPPDRLRFVAQDTGMTALVSQSHLLERLAGVGVEVVTLDQAPAADDAADDGAGDGAGDEAAEGAPVTGVTPADRVYVVYTSGSTGRPKGVEIEHRGLVNLCTWHQEVHRVTPRDRVSQLSNLAFDATAWEIWPYLTAGASVHLPDEITRGSPAALVDWFAEHGITIAFLVAPMAELLLEQDGGDELPLRILLTGADRLRRAPRGALPFRFFNNYGPTETTVISTWAEVLPPPRGRTPPPIGRPLANTRVYVLDRWMRPVPIGVPGEVFIGGDGLARGYLGRPALTAERFVPDPFSGSSGSRLYRTGDLARFLPDGQLDFLGRADRQVKLRGFRIELGEVEAALNRHDRLRQVAVMLREDSPGDRQLVAYLVPEPGFAPTAGELRAFLEARLPGYMVPAAFAILDALPLTSNDKVDLRALPPPARASTAAREPAVAPRNELERRFAAIWEEVLGVDGVGVHDDFFALGGDSIRALSVAAAAREEGLPLSMRQIFASATIADLALAAGSERQPEADPASRPTAGEVPLTPIQSWFFEQWPEAPAHFGQALLFEVPGNLDAAALGGAAGETVGRHDALRLRFRRRDGRWSQLLSDDRGEGVFRRVDLGAEGPGPRRERIERAVAELQRSLDPERGPVLRIALLDLGSGWSHRLLFAAHHLVVDQVSWRPLLRDFWSAYEQIAGGRPVELPEGTTPFAAWAERLPALAASDAIAEQAEHWLAVPGDVPVALPLDGDGPNLEGTTASETARLDRTETERLAARAAAEPATTLERCVLAAVVGALARWTGRERQVVEIERHGRESLWPELDLSRTVGWFTAVAPVVLEATDGDGVVDLARAVGEQLASVPDPFPGYGLLRYLTPGSGLRRRLAARPTPSVRFNYLGRFGDAEALGSPWPLAPEEVGPMRSPDARRSHLLEVAAAVVDGCLEVGWQYSRDLHDRETVERLAGECRRILRDVRGVPGTPGRPRRAPASPPAPASDGEPAADRPREGPGADAPERVYALSPMQRGMLYHSLERPGDGIYCTQFCFEVDADLDLPALRRAIDLLAERNGALRTSFSWRRDGPPVQEVHRGARLPIAVEDWRGLPPDEQEERLVAAKRADRRRGFDLSRAPLARLALYRLGASRHHLVASFHHAILDGWSAALLRRELLELHRACRTGAPVEPARRRPYSDFIAWLERQDPARAEAFWREELAGYGGPPAATGLERRGGAPGRRVGHRRHRAVLPPALASSLQRFAAAARITSGTLFQGALAVLLGRHGGVDDVVFGMTDAGRPAELRGSDSMVGLFINTLPVRARLDDDARVGPWLRRLQRRQAEARRFGFTSLTEIQGWSEVPRGRPLFETVLLLENYPLRPATGEEPAEGSATLVEVNEKTNFPLVLEIQPGDAPGLAVTYDAGRLDGEAVEGWLECLTTLLEEIALDPGRRLGELALLSPAARWAVLAAGRGPAGEAPREPVHRQIARRAALRPDRVAVEGGGCALTYGELWRGARRLARRLRSRGVGRGAVVGLLAERSPEMMSGLLGILEAGAAYLPLDPALPEQRVRTVLEDAGAALLLTSGSSDGLPRLGALPVVDLEAELDSDLDRDDDAAGADGDGPLPVSPGELAYVIYTSGSTGRPKGVEVTHRSLANLLASMREEPGCAEEDTLLAVTTLAFDISALELLLPLVAGAKVVLAPPEVRADGEALSALLAACGATRMQATPTLWRLLLDSGWRGDPRLVALCGGEVMPRELADGLLDRCASVWNLYGPTETTIWSARHRVEREPGPVPIGDPIAGTDLHVLDRDLEPVPPGVAGELFIGGIGLARGYHGRPAMTAERFLPDPHAERPGARLFRTGDRARRRRDGRLEFLGRLDHQVKLRGHRVEPEEIERALAEVPGVRQATVVVRGEDPPAARLVAYFVPSGAAERSSEALREALARRLPDYMIPSAFVPLDRLPLTAGGKVDRRALPDPGRLPRDLGARFVAPRTATEKALAELWGELLGVERVGVRDTFFELGGHSLLLVRLQHRVRRTFDTDLTLLDLLAAPTIEEQAAALGDGRRSAPDLEKARRLAGRRRRARARPPRRRKR